MSVKTQILKKILFVSIICVITALVSGCDWSARWDLRRAEKVLDKATELNAEFCGEHHARKAYLKAQSALEEGMYYARRRDINLARDKAQEAKDWAEEAVFWAEKYHEEIRKEKESLGAYKD